MMTSVILYQDELLPRKQMNGRSLVMDALDGEPIDLYEQTYVLGKNSGIR